MEQKLNSNSSAGAAADSDMQPIVIPSADIAVNPVLCAVNHFAPSSPDWLLSKYKGLREVNGNRDKDYSPLHDSIMSAIAENLREHNLNEFGAVWTSSMFPERLTKEILRLVEQQIQRGV